MSLQRNTFHKSQITLPSSYLFTYRSRIIYFRQANNIMSFVVRLPTYVAWEAMKFLSLMDLMKMVTSHKEFNLFVVDNAHFQCEGPVTVSKNPSNQVLWIIGKQIGLLHLKFESLFRNDPVNNNTINFETIAQIPPHLFNNVVKVLQFTFDSTIISGQGQLIAQVVNSVFHCSELRLEMNMLLAQQVLDNIAPLTMQKLDSLILKVRHCRNGMTLKLPAPLIDYVTNM